jgi:tetratricopeptide (TPR) repeat protein
MLGYIIPPIVIVLSLAALIFFLFRKSARISEELILEEKRKENKGEKAEGRKLFRFTQFVLQITERIMQRFKLFSLKFYNKTDNWFHSIKEKREQRSNSGKEAEESYAEKNESRKTAEDFFGIRIKKEPRVDNVVTFKEEEEVEVEPMISKEVVQPDSKVGIRNEFEKALIERIAFNPKDIEAYERLGDYYIEIGNFNDSLACFEEVLKLSPGSRKAKLKMRRLQKIVYSNKL